MASEPIGQFIKLVSLLCQNDLFSMLHTVPGVRAVGAAAWTWEALTLD